MNSRLAFRSFELVGAATLVTSVFWLLVGALVWPYASPDGEIATPSLRDASVESVPVADTTPVVRPAANVRPLSQSVGGHQLLMPVAGVAPAELVDTYSQARADGARRHDAIDIMAPEGTPVLAASAGTVERLYTSEAGGITAYVRSPDRQTMFYYAHLQRYAPGLAEGQVLRPGDAIGAVGTTGNASATSPHLHFAIWRMTPQARWWDNGEALNPYPLLQAGRY